MSRFISTDNYALLYTLLAIVIENGKTQKTTLILITDKSDNIQVMSKHFSDL